MLQHQKTRTENVHRSSAGLVVWCTGLSGAGKTTLCEHASCVLRARGFRVLCLDGDVLRQTVSADLGFSFDDRLEHARRVALLADRKAEENDVVLVSTISPYRCMREVARSLCRRFAEVYIYADLVTCIARDPKGLYRRAITGEIALFTGVSDPYEEPLNPDFVCNTTNQTVQQCAHSFATRIASLTAVEVPCAAS